MKRWRNKQRIFKASL